jgi:hypothetical protein
MQRDARNAANKVVKALGLRETAFEFRRDEVEIKSPKDSRRFLAQVRKLNPTGNWGGYQTGYKSWVLCPGYVSSGDWNDKSSRCHY